MLVDRRNGQTMLARDRFGVKPLFTSRPTTGCCCSAPKPRRSWRIRHAERQLDMIDAQSRAARRRPAAGYAVRRHLGGRARHVSAGLAQLACATHRYDDLDPDRGRHVAAHVDASDGALGSRPQRTRCGSGFTAMPRSASSCRAVWIRARSRRSRRPDFDPTSLRLFHRFRRDSGIGAASGGARGKSSLAAKRISRSHRGRHGEGVRIVRVARRDHGSQCAWHRQDAARRTREASGQGGADWRGRRRAAWRLCLFRARRIAGRCRWRADSSARCRNSSRSTGRAMAFWARSHRRYARVWSAVDLEAGLAASPMRPCVRTVQTAASGS